MTTATTSPDDGVIQLTVAQCRAVLKGNHIGRIAYTLGTRVDIEPVSYAATGDWIFIRSASGTKMQALAHAPYVAFEVDELGASSGWRSVVAHGTVYLMSEHGTGANRLVFERALRALRSFIPETLREDDPMPFRDTVYGIHIDNLTGRAAALGATRTPRVKRTNRARSAARAG